MATPVRLNAPPPRTTTTERPYLSPPRDSVTPSCVGHNRRLPGASYGLSTPRPSPPRPPTPPQCGSRPTPLSAKSVTEERERERERERSFFPETLRGSATHTGHPKNPSPDGTVLHGLRSCPSPFHTPPRHLHRTPARGRARESAHTPTTPRTAGPRRPEDGATRCNPHGSTPTGALSTRA